MPIHKRRTYQRWGGTVNTSLCGRLRKGEGMNVTGDEQLVSWAERMKK